MALSTLASGAPRRTGSIRPRPGFDRDARIGVLGAGAAGLTAAHTLVRDGFRRVTVLERSTRVGGKCCSLEHEGRSYELGAVVLTPAYKHVRALLRERGIAERTKLSSAFLDVETGRMGLRPPVVLEAGWRALATSCLRLGLASLHHRALREPGLAGFPPDTFVPFATWAAERKMGPAARLFLEPLFTPLGYGYIDRAPAAYVLKLATIVGVPFYEVTDGYQALWEAVARDLDVRLGVTALRVKRGDGPIVVETERERHTFDALIVTSPLDEAIHFLDATPDEIELAGKIRYTDYRVVVASVSGLPATRYVFVPKAFVPAARGDVMLWYKRWSDRDVYTFYAYGDEPGPMRGAPATTLDATIDRVARTVARLGGRMTRVLDARAWKYFPHVSCEDMAGGFFERIEAAQGARGTYYAGELLGFGTVETVVRQARDLALRHLVAPARTSGCVYSAIT